MRIHHLNCVSSCPLGGALMDGASVGALRGRLTAHCLLVETNAGLVLVDTGYGLRDVADPHGRLSAFFLSLNAPELREGMTAIRQIEALGFAAKDVTHIVLSHLDFDHAGGLDDFPFATVHMLEDEIATATARRTPLDRMRYRPQQWSSRPRWRAYEVEGGEPFFGFERVRALDGVPPEIVMVPLAGHTLGHAGVAVRARDRWLFYAADAYFFHGEMDPAKPRCTPGLRFYQTLMEKDRSLRLSNQARLRELVRTRGGEVDVFCAHDVAEFERLASRTHREPAARAPETRAPVPTPASTSAPTSGSATTPREVIARA